MRIATAVLLALLAAPAEEPPPSIADQARALLSPVVRTSWDAARSLVERPGSESSEIRKALADLAADASLALEMPRNLKRAERGPLLDRIRQAALHQRLAKREITLPDGMVAVPGGIAGRPITHEAVLVPDLLVDRIEVTRDAFARFLAAGTHRPEGERFLEGWTDGKPPTGTGAWPVTHVSREDAAAFAKWRGARLPTAEEWMIVRGGCARSSYPWADRSKPGLANVLDARGARRPEPADGRPEGASPLGVLRLAGNVAEWTSTPRGDDPKRGWIAGESFMAVPAFRTTLLVAARATTRRKDLGFRCVARIPDPPR